MSPDGRFVLFASTANDLVATTNGARMVGLNPPVLNVFLRDRTNATTALVSINLMGMNGGNGDSLPAGISSDGRFALFESEASDLVAGDTNGVSDVLVRDVVSGTTLLVSVSTNGDPGDGESRSAVMTPDGRYVAFVSGADNLVPGDTNGITDVFLRDLQQGTTVPVSAGAKVGRAATANAVSGAPAVSADGQYVAFYSMATNLVPGATNVGEIYVRDIAGGTTFWASAGARAALQTPFYQLCLSFGPSISSNGQFVTFESVRSYTTGQSIPVPITTVPGWGVVLRYHVGSGLTDTVATNAAVPISVVENARNPVMTPDGRFVAFVGNVIIGTITNSCIRVWDGQTSTDVLASVNVTGAMLSNSICEKPAITPDGQTVVFLSNGTNLVTNSLVGEFHLYARDLRGGTTTLLGAGTNGAGAGVAPVTQPRVSDDGGLVAFEAPDGTLVPHDANKAGDVFVREIAGGVTEIISLHDPALASEAPDGPSTLSVLSLSGQGSFVAFVSDADDLVPNDTNGYRDVFVRDLLADSTMLVSVDPWGAASGNGVSGDAALSADGRFVAFTSGATNLVAGDNNQATDVFVRDLLWETTELVSVNANGFSGNGASYSPMIGADGRGVLFHSKANDLAAGMLNSGRENIYWRDLWSGATYLLSGNNGNQSASLAATVTPSGRYAVFGTESASWYVWDSLAGNRIYTNTAAPGGPVSNIWVSADAMRIAYAAGSPLSLYLVDRLANTTTTMGAVSWRANPCFSGDGRYLAYATTSANAPGDTNGVADVYLYDCQSGTNVLVSQAFNAPASADGASDSPAISLDGRFIAYRSAASNLVPNDANGVPDIYLWDRVTGATLLLSRSRSMDSSADNRSLTPVFSGDGRMLYFESWASDLVEGDCNRASDLFAFNIYASGTIPLLQAQVIPAGAGAGQGVWVTWPVVSSKTYSVQYKNSLGDAAWQTLGAPVSIVGSQGYLYDLPVGTSQRFYRIVAH